MSNNKKRQHFYQNVPGFFTWPELYKEMVKRFPAGSKFVEVGVFRGRSLAFLITEIVNSGKKIELTGVDDFTSTMGWKLNFDVYEDFLKNLQPVAGEYKILKMDSAQAATQFDNHSLDFVFIDAAHDYDAVRRDIAAYMPKMKPGGVIAGHDYTDEWPGLKKAVHEIFGDRVIIQNDCWRVEL